MKAVGICGSDMHYFRAGKIGGHLALDQAIQLLKPGGTFFIKASFDRVRASAIRLEFQSQEKFAAGVHEWRVE
jgi:threonine dehydrogenase-like Zn-dependent dehydrogenase